MKRHAIRQLAAMGVTAMALSGCAGTNLGALGDILGGAMGGTGGTGQQQGQVLVEQDVGHLEGDPPALDDRPAGLTHRGGDEVDVQSLVPPALAGLPVRAGTKTRSPTRRGHPPVAF